MARSPERELLQRLARERDRPWSVGTILRTGTVKRAELEQVRNLRRRIAQGLHLDGPSRANISES